MQSEIDSRVIRLAEYVSERNATVRSAAAYWGVSKSTVHKDLTARLKYLSPELYESVARVLNKNRAERHIRGGMATKKKFEKYSCEKK